MSRPAKFSLQTTRLFSFLGLAVFSFMVYLVSADSQILSIRVSGNSYYSNQEIYRMANLSGNSRMLFHPEFAVQNSLEADPMIENVEVSYDGNTLSIQVEEKLLIGYYLNEEQPVALAISGETIPIDEAHLPVLQSLPFIAGLSNTQMQDMAAGFNRYRSLFDSSVFSKIAEIVPWEESYDDSMVKMTMTDGNVIISSLSDLVMMSKYQALLSKLEGNDVCLFLDAQNSAIDKISCSYIYMSAEERDQQRKELKEELERLAKEAEAEAKRQEEERLEQERLEQEQQQALEEGIIEPSEEGTLDLNDPWSDYYQALEEYQNSLNSYFGIQDNEEETYDPYGGYYGYDEAEYGFYSDEAAPQE